MKATVKSYLTVVFYVLIRNIFLKEEAVNKKERGRNRMDFQLAPSAS